jgi:metal transporter CNNM
MPVLRHHHWLLVTLLFCNAVALETLPIFLDRVVPSAYAILISVIAILFFGEVIP